MFKKSVLTFSRACGVGMEWDGKLQETDDHTTQANLAWNMLACSPFSRVISSIVGFRVSIVLSTASMSSSPTAADEGDAMADAVAFFPPSGRLSAVD
mmetsp:Transcript_11695/g.32576  ORF Transcript_11695/g.32576 Transcript_11695/m.32576 type:complete len:97 (+) Transcript_11695:3-293(+)